MGVRDCLLNYIQPFPLLTSFHLAKVVRRIHLLSTARDLLQLRQAIGLTRVSVGGRLGFGDQSNVVGCAVLEVLD